MRGVDEFLAYAQHNVPNHNGMLLCPCVKCGNLSLKTVDEIRRDLICHGITQSYTRWRRHGEDVVSERPSQSTSSTSEYRSVQNAPIEDFIRDIGEESFRTQVVEQMKVDAETPLYDGCKLTRLEATLKLFVLKAKHGWTDKSFTELLTLLQEDILPKGNALPGRNYDAKKVLCPMGMEYEKIHACPNDCILY